MIIGGNMFKPLQKKKCDTCGKEKGILCFDRRSDGRGYKTDCRYCLEQLDKNNCLFCGRPIKRLQKYCSVKETGRNCSYMHRVYLAKHMLIVFQAIRRCPECKGWFGIHGINSKAVTCTQEKCQKEYKRKQSRVYQQEYRKENSQPLHVEKRPEGCMNGKKGQCRHINHCLWNSFDRYSDSCFEHEKKVYGGSPINYHVYVGL